MRVAALLLVFLVMTASVLGENVCDSSASESDDLHCKQATNGKMLEFSMLHYDSIALLVFVDLKIAPYILEHKTAAPQDVAKEFNLTLRAASALMVTLCRQGFLQVAVDSEDSVDDIQYGLSSSAALFLTEGEATTTNFIQSMNNHFWTPQKLLDAARPQSDEEDLMSQHIEESDETQRANARAFMRHMNSQSYSCAEAFASKIGLVEGEERPMDFLDVGGGSAIYSIAAARANPGLKSMIYELEKVKPVTEEFIAEANMSDQIKVVTGDFFSEEPFPTADAALFANILHDWSDETNIKLLKKAYDCLRPGGRVIVSEVLLGDNVEESSQASTSMNVLMLQWTQGRQYRGKELVRRMENIGFVDATVVKLVDDYSLVIGYKQQE